MVSQPHGDGRRWRLQLLVQQAEGHGGPVALQRLAQQVVQLSLQVVNVPQPLPAVQLAEVGRRLLQCVQGQAPLVCTEEENTCVGVRGASVGNDKGRRGQGVRHLSVVIPVA